MIFKSVFFVFFVSCNLLLNAQDISGTWTGNYQKTFLVSNPEKLVVEIFLHSDSIVTGVSHLYYKREKYEHYKIKGVFRKKDSTIIFTEDSTIAVKLGFMEDNCLGNYTMKLSVTDTALTFSGKWKDKSRSIFKCPSSLVKLQKMLNKPSKDSASNKDESILKRAVDVQSLIEIKSSERDSIKIEVYDNGVIDNDSVSVYFNDNIIIENEMISFKPITFYVSLDKQYLISKIKLAAKSLGQYPPCTALMIITTKGKRYEVDLSSNFNSNATVELFLKE